MTGPFALLDGHEQVVYGHDEASGLRCIIGLHSTVLGPGLGGTRFYPYPDEEAAVVDVLRLSKGMAYKNACAGLDLGGGKAVIIGDPQTDKSEALLRAFGRIVESLNGRYVTACDVGTTPADLTVVRRETRWATGYDVEAGGSGDSGVLTAYGTYIGMRACAARVWGDPDLGGRHVAIQGTGKVGRRLAAHLHADGAKLTVADVDKDSTEHCAERYAAEVVDTADVHAVDADIFSPNALGAVIDDVTVPQLRCRVIAGAANNQLAEERHDSALADAGILYAPDYVINAGGVIQVSQELHPAGYSETRARHAVERIGERLTAVFDLADAEGLPTGAAADVLAERRMASVGRLRGFHLGGRS